MKDSLRFPPRLSVALVVPLVVACSNRITVEADKEAMLNPNVTDFLRQEGGYMQAKVTVRKKTAFRNVIDVSRESVVVFLGSRDRPVEDRDTASVPFKSVAAARYTVPREINGMSLRYAGLAAVGTAFVGGVVTLLAYVYDVHNSSENVFYWYPFDKINAVHPYVGWGTAFTIPVSAVVGFFVGRSAGRKRDRARAEKLRVFVGKE